MISFGMKKVLGFVGFWAVVLLAFFLVFWKPTMQRIETQSERLKYQQGLIRDFRSDIEAYPRTITDDKLRMIEENLEDQLARIPSKEEVPMVLNQIRESSTQKTGVRVTEISNIQARGTATANTQTEAGSIPTMTYRLVVEGSATNLLRFLYELETGERFIAIESVTMIRLAGRTGRSTDDVKMTAILSIFYLDLGEVPSAPSLSGGGQKGS